MPHPQSNNRPWRARAFHLTRDRRFLIKGVTIILAVSALIAVAVQTIQKTTTRPVRAATAEEDAQMVEEFHRLQNSPHPQPGRLATWVRHTAAILAETEARHRPVFDPIKLTLGEMDLEPTVRKHASSADAYPLFTAFVRCLFATSGMDMQADRDLLIQAAGQRPPVRHAGEFLADFYYYSSQPSTALPYYLQEVQYSNAQYPRRMALNIALQDSNVEVLRQLASNPDILAEANPIQLKGIATLLDDRIIALRATAALQVARWSQFSSVALALFAAGIWYIILVHSGKREPYRWLRHLAPVLAGVLSVTLLYWLQISLDYESLPNMEDNPTNQLMHWILYVGMPEEGCKVLLFAFFLPLLLRERSVRQAALTAGCVGLGFALNENISYFSDKGMSVAMVRLLTANVLHFTLTGILGVHLYQLFRSRFHHATNFILAFLGVSVAHALYNFTASSIGLNWEVDIAHIIIVALTTRLYLRTLHQEHEPMTGSTPISRTCVFWFGTALLVGVLMIVTVAESHSLTGITVTLMQAIALIPVALIYQHEFNEVQR